VPPGPRTRVCVDCGAPPPLPRPPAGPYGGETLLPDEHLELELRRLEVRARARDTGIALALGLVVGAFVVLFAIAVVLFATTPDRR